MPTQSFKRSKQTGALMLEVSLALMISALAAVGTMRETIRAENLRSADIEADTMDAYRIALQRYVDDAYVELQADGSVSRDNILLATNPPTIPPIKVILATGDNPGQSRQPTIQNLTEMGYLTMGFSNTTLMIDGGKYQNQVSRLPVGCVGITCNIEGLAWVDKPYYVRGTENTTKEINGPVIGQMMSRLGGFGGTSVPGLAATITGNGASWSVPNPLSAAGNPEGVVAARFGFSAAAFLNYVRIGDLRDPNLAGKLTIASDFRTGGNTILSGTLAVTGAATVNNTLTVAGATAVNSTMTVLNATTLQSTLGVNGDTTIGGRLDVAGKIAGS